MEKYSFPPKPCFPHFLTDNARTHVLSCCTVLVSSMALECAIIRVLGTSSSRDSCNDTFDIVFTSVVIMLEMKSAEKHFCYFPSNNSWYQLYFFPDNSRSKHKLKVYFIYFWNILFWEKYIFPQKSRFPRFLTDNARTRILSCCTVLVLSRAFE